MVDFYYSFLRIPSLNVEVKIINKKAALWQGNRAVPQLFFSA